MQSSANYLNTIYSASCHCLLQILIPVQYWFITSTLQFLKRYSNESISWNIAQNY